MARLVRPMLKGDDGLPLIGDKSKCLGVRATGPNADVDLDPPGDETGDVLSNHKGLSVSADWRDLPRHLIPEHLDDGLNGARGKNMAVFVLGKGPFAEGPVAAGLEMIFKARSDRAGVIRPEATVSLSKYQLDLQATRSGWIVDES